MIQQSFVIKLNGTVKLYTGSYPVIIGGNGSCGCSKIYGLFMLVHENSFIKSKLHTTTNNMELSFIANNETRINKLASDIATKLDENNNRIIVGDCYFIFETDLITLIEFKKMIHMANTELYTPLFSFTKINNLPVDILNKFVNKERSPVCKYWCHVWHTKPIALNLETNKFNLALKFQNIVEIQLGKNTIMNEQFFQFTRLKKLSINNNTCITDDILKKFTNVKSLSLRGNSIISDDSLKLFTNLTALVIHNNQTIAGESLQYLTNVISLNCGTSTIILNKSLLCLANITQLKMVFGKNSHDVNSFYDCSNIIGNFTNLKKLYIVGNNSFILNELERLVNLTKLKISHNSDISIYTLRNLTKLISITAKYCTGFHSQSRLSSLLNRLPNLRIKEFPGEAEVIGCRGD